MRAHSAVGLLVLVLSAVSAARADTGTSVGDGGGEGGGPFAGLLQSPEANLFTGGLSQTIAIRIPPGRKMATPNLNLVYSTGGGGGLYGEGWSMPLGTIERNTKWGVPRCVGSTGFDATNEFVLSLNGSAVELVSFGAGPGGSEVYRPRTDQSFLEALRRPDNSWEVFDRSGMRYRFGTTAESRRTRGTLCDFTSVWGVTQIKDPNNNTADLAYLSGRDTLQLDKVQYGGTATNPAFQVRFDYVSHTNVMQSYRNGVFESADELVDRIHVEAKTSETGGFVSVRIFDLKYDHEYGGSPPSGCSAPDRALLCEVSANDGLPTQSFEYSPSAFSFGTAVGYDNPGSFQHLRSATMNADVEDSVMDMNGDGRLDFVNSADSNTNTYTVYYGLANGGISPTVSTKWCASGGTIDGAHMRKETVFSGGFAQTQMETVDMNGDGLPDFVDSLYSATQWKVYPGTLSLTCPGVTGAVPGFNPTPILWAAPGIELGETEKDMSGNRVRTWKRLVDMNADGRPDLVEVVYINPGNTAWQVHLNSGQGFVTMSEGSFGASAATQGPLTEELKSGGVRRTTRDLFDFNGDGLPDVVRQGVDAQGNPAILLYLNNGQWFDTPPLALSLGVGEESAVRAIDDGSGEGIADFLDVNGDGLPDRVRVAGTTWWVRLNLGTSLAAEVSWGALGSIRDNNGKGNTKIDMVDWNHDGMLDRVDANTNTWQVQLGLPASGPGIRPYLLTAAKNSVGGATYPTYQPSTRFTNTLLPFVSWLVTATRRTDGLCSGTASACLDLGNEIQRTYSYANGYFDGPTREFRGFGTVTENFIHASGATQTSRRVVAFSQANHTRGQITREETISSGNTLIRTEDFTWLTQVDGPRTQVFLGEKQTNEFDVDGAGEPPLCRMDRNVAPDVYGRVATRCTLPCGTSAPGSCTANTVGKVTTATAWANPTFVAGSEPAVRERPASVAVTYVKPDGSTSPPLSEQTFTYHWPTGNVLTAVTTGDSSTGGNATVATGYDGTFGNMTSVTDPRGNPSTSSYTATPFQLFPSTETNAAGHAVQKQWDLRYGKEIQVTGPNAEVSVATYDPAGRVTCQAKPTQTCADPAAAYTYVNGNPSGAFEAKLSYVQVKTREPNNTTATLPGYLLTRTYLDALGRERATATWRVVGPGNSLVWVVTKQIDYDAMGAVKKVYAPYQAAAAGTGAVGLVGTPSSRATEYSHTAAVVDPTNRVRSVKTPDTHVTTTRYDAAWTHVTDPEGNKTSSEVDFLGREKARILRQGSSSVLMQYAYSYDGLDRLLTTTVGSATVTNAWDRLGRKNQVADPDSGTWLTFFDKNGNPILQQDPKTGQHAEACYDKLNRVTLQCSYANDSTTPAMSCPASGAPSCGTGGTPIATYTYDTQPGDAECASGAPIGQLTSVLDTSGGECTGYDTRGHVTVQKKTILHATVSTTAKTSFVYDQADHVKQVTYPDADVVDHGYQADGLPDSVEQIIAAVEYDLFGRATKITSFRNTEDLYGFDTTGSDNFRLKTLQTKQFSTGTVYLNLDHVLYWPRGKLREVRDYRDAGAALSNAASYCYDGIGRLTRVDRDPTAGSDPCASAADETFVHNSQGNLEAKNGASFGFAGAPHQPTSFGTTYASITYDANGNRTLKDKGGGTKDELIYDARGVLTQVKRWTGGSVTSSQTNLYDYAGARVVKAPSSGAGTTMRSYNRYADAGGGNLQKHYYLGGQRVATWVVSAPTLSEVEPELLVPPTRIPLPPGVLYPVAGGVVLLLFLPLGSRRRLGVRLSLARSAGLSVVWLTATSPVVLFAGCGSDPVVRVYHGDRLGSTQVVTDWNGAIYRQMRYFAYGEIRGRFNAAGASVGFAEDARFEFTGYETDFAGLDYAGARFFDPELAQFGSHDPAGQYPSPYAYGPGDPINGTDPTGADFWDVFQYGSPQMYLISSIVRTYQATGSWGKALGQFAKGYAINMGISLVSFGVGELVGLAAFAADIACAPVIADGVTSALQSGFAVQSAVSALQSGDPVSVAMAVVGLTGAALQIGGMVSTALASGYEAAPTSPAAGGTAQAGEYERQWEGSDLPDSGVIAPGEDIRIAAQDHGSSVKLDIFTPKEIPTTPPPNVAVEGHLTPVADLNRLPGTASDSAIPFSKQFKATPGTRFRVLEVRMKPGGEPLRGMTTIENTGNVPLGVRISTTPIPKPFY